ncbi:hemolysin-type calcium-binding protein, partial [Nitrosomonas sp. JL21]|uniref:hypothetical protein n=1 Tax=Nitrosomonas sp. JL21 TaxID=153949 RepID=UPI001960C920
EITYHWLRDGVDTGATGIDYLLTQADVGKVFTVQATYTDLGGHAESMTSAATAAVADVNDPPVGSVTITGTAEQGQTLSVSNDLTDVDGLGEITYHWLRDGVDTGVTETSFVLTQADIGKVFTVQATYTDAGGQAESVTSAPTAAVTDINDLPVGSVTITGTAEQGQMLNVSDDLTDADGIGAITYHWLRDGSDTGATGASYLLTQADVGKAVTVQAMYTDLGGHAESILSNATAPVANVNDTPAGNVTISGTAEQGQTLSVSNDLTDADGLGEITYHWLRDGIDTGATGIDYLLTQADVGKVFTVQATYTDVGGQAESVMSAATAVVADVNDLPVGSVTISGTAEQGQTLSVSNDLTDADGLGAITYHWLRDDVDTGVTETNYVLTQADIGKVFTVQATYTDLGGHAENVLSNPTVPVINLNDVPAGSVTITGTAEQGQTLNVSNDLIDADGLGEITYHWLRDGIDTGATGASYLLTQADVGKAVTAQATYTDLGGHAESVLSNATALVANVNDAPVGAVTITGAAEQGQTLNVSNDLADADGLGEITYHWLRDGVDTGITGVSYGLTQADIGKVFAVQATYTDLSGQAESVMSAATLPVADVNDAPVGNVTITGTAQQGQTLNVSDNLTDADGLGAITYHWLRDGVDTGATGASYVLAPADVGKVITVQAAYTDLGGHAESVTSNATAPVSSGNQAPTLV